ncbi:helix-turn-helix domain-containing protein [Clostridioides sp. ES-S-0108-01]|uniref:helix-turn-helix domain-containing protein n=1 Tax=Clostridioides sp. ES-S-0108-01 TaxID=2770773 RepID=UPI001D0C50DF|nr:helix-turn-helix transcriptional regulator [Clostridioides sp. ES-S-0107-01]
MNEIERLQKYLLLVRRTVGWIAEEFGDRIGVTRQTINNLEAGRNKLNKTQYIAMRSVLDVEMHQYPEETEMLNLILDVFVDHPENYDEKEREEFLTKANMVTPSILAGSTSRKDVSKEIMAVADGIGLIAEATPPFAPVEATSAWLLKTIFDKKK